MCSGAAAAGDSIDARGRAPCAARMTEEPTHHHMVADAVQIKLEMPAVDTKVISPEELRAGAIVQPEPWMVRHLMDHPEAMRDQLNLAPSSPIIAGLSGDSRDAVIARSGRGGVSDGASTSRSAASSRSTGRGASSKSS